MARIFGFYPNYQDSNSCAPTIQKHRETRRVIQGNRKPAQAKIMLRNMNHGVSVWC